MLNKLIALQAYMRCALWSTTGEDGEPLDASYDSDDIAAATRDAMAQELDDFMVANATKLLTSGLTSSQVGHDFWLTRNGHGAGFWDRGLGRLGQEISEAAKTHGSRDLYVGDDKLIHQQ